MSNPTHDKRTRPWTVYVLFALSIALVAAATSSVAQNAITAIGNVSATGLTLTGLNCTGNMNGGALTTNASGVVSCSDDDAGGGGGGGNVMLLHGGASLNGVSQERYAIMQRENQTNLSTTTVAVPRAGTLKNLYVTSSATLTSPGEVTVTVWTGASLGTLAATSLSVTIDNLDGGAVVSDTSNTANVSAGNLVVVRFTSNGSYADGSVTFNSTFELESP